MFFKFKKKEEFISPMEGKLLEMEQVPDEVFAQRLMGDGFAVELAGADVVAPVSGMVAAAFPTGHAFGIKMEDGTEVLIHIGIDTVELNGNGFEVLVKQGEQVKQGQILVHVNCSYIEEQGKSLISPVIFTSGQKIELLKKGLYVRCMEKNIIRIKK